MRRGALEILAEHSEAVATTLQRLLESLSAAPARLLESITYSLNAGGKRLRPALVMESFAACAGSGEDRIAALHAAGAIELIHTFSLVHDDLPAMDDDDLRRGKPTNHKVFGEAMAILAGDAMTTLAFELLSGIPEPSIAVKLVRELSSASGPAGMIGGQVLDILGENQTLNLDQVMQIHHMKTGALLRCACRMGAIAARVDDLRLDALSRFGEHLGLAFQIVDDVLDVTSSPDQLGKATQKDAGKGKNTYPALMGLEQSRAKAMEELALAMRSLDRFDGQADGLRSLARLVVDRSR